MQESKTQQLAIGHGFDVHAFGENRACILGGVTVPYELGLVGHSDADVLVHAMMDALLGAAKAGDIGELFPDNDPAYEGASSIMLLQRVTAYIHELGYELIDADCTVAAQAPKLAPYKETMRENIANAMGVPKDCIGIKATTTEHLGFVGRKEGIAAWAVVLMQRSV